MRSSLISILAGAILVSTPVAASNVEVRLLLPQRARIDLANRDSVAVAPFLVVRQEGEQAFRGRSIDIQKEFSRYLEKILRRETRLDIIEAGPVDYPIYDIDQLSREEDFWRVLGERLQADLILSGSLDFDIQDRTGYRLEEFVSPFDGRTHYRQVLVEQTGFEYDILMHVYDGATGSLIYSDNFKDFQSVEGGEAAATEGMFGSLHALEDRIVNIFSQKAVEASRTLFTN